MSSSFGIRGKLLGALAALTGVTALACLVGFSALGCLDQARRAILADSVPATLQAQRLADSAGMAAQAPTLATVADNAARKTAYPPET